MQFSLALRNLILISVLGFIPLAWIDICVLEQIIKPMAHQLGKTENDFVVTRFGITTLPWHFAFIPCGLVLLATVGYAINGWRGAITGLMLFALGYEDWWYYWLQGHITVPPELPWLDQQPGVSWTRYIFKHRHVSQAGMVLATGLGLVLALLLLGKKSRL